METFARFLRYSVKIMVDSDSRLSLSRQSKKLGKERSGKGKAKRFVYDFQIDLLQMTK